MSNTTTTTTTTTTREALWHEAITLVQCRHTDFRMALRPSKAAVMAAACGLDSDAVGAADAAFWGHIRRSHEQQASELEALYAARRAGGF